MSNNATLAQTPRQRPFFTTREHAWMISTFIITPIVASLLSIGGYIPTDPVSAAVDGILVSIVYVGFRVMNGYRRLRLHRKTQEELVQQHQ